MWALVKVIGPGFPYVELAFFRALLAMPLMGTLLWRSGHRVRPARPLLMVARGLLGVGAMLGMFFALPRGKFADFAIIGKTQPLLIAMLSQALIREPPPRVALLSLALGFAGALLVIKPGFGLLNVAALVVLGAAALSALAHLAVRRLNATDPPLLIVFHFTLVVGVVSGALSLPVFVAPDLRQWGMLIAVAQLAAAGQLLMTTAYGRDAAPVVAAASYASVIYALVLGFAFWGELPDGLALLGGILIVGAGLLLARGRRGVRQPPAPPS